MPDTTAAYKVRWGKHAHGLTTGHTNEGGSTIFVHVWGAPGWDRVTQATGFPFVLGCMPDELRPDDQEWTEARLEAGRAAAEELNLADLADRLGHELAVWSARRVETYREWPSEGLLRALGMARDLDLTAAARDIETVLREHGIDASQPTGL